MPAIPQPAPPNPIRSSDLAYPLEALRPTVPDRGRQALVRVREPSHTRESAGTLPQRGLAVLRLWVLDAGPSLETAKPAREILRWDAKTNQALRLTAALGTPYSVPCH